MQATHAVVAMSLIIFQVPGNFLSSWSKHGKGDSPLGDRICLCGTHIMSFKVFGMNNRIAMWVIWVLGEASTCQKCQADMDVSEIQQ